MINMHCLGMSIKLTSLLSSNITNIKDLNGRKLLRKIHLLRDGVIPVTFSMAKFTFVQEGSV